MNGSSGDEVHALERKELVVCGERISRLGSHLFRIGRLECEHYDALADPERVIEELRSGRFDVDVFTFLQAIPDQEPHYDYFLEWDSLAVLPVGSHDEWWAGIGCKTRNLIRKAEKKGVEIRPAQLDDEFVRGVEAIYGESPFRQGKRFLHYGKSGEVIRRDLETFPGRSEFYGAFHEGTLIGFIKVVRGDGFASLMHIISTLSSRNLSPTNALVAHAVRLCSEQGIPYLHYGNWSTGGLGLFKVNHGFQPHRVPRYWIPLSVKGRFLLRAGFHHPMKDRLPPEWRDRLVRARAEINKRRTEQAPPRDSGGRETSSAE